MLDKDRDVQGVGAYFELKPSSEGFRSTFQLVLLPEGYTETLLRVPAMAFYRSIYTYSPRKSWRRVVINMGAIDYSDLDTIAKAVTPILYTATTGPYTAVAKPLLFEVAKSDLTSASKGKLPSRINSKIKTMRLTHGYPESVIAVKEEEESVA